MRKTIIRKNYVWCRIRRLSATHSSRNCLDLQPEDIKAILQESLQMTYGHKRKEGDYSSSFFFFASSNMAFIVGLP